MSTVIVKEQSAPPMPTNTVLLRPHQMVQHQQDIQNCAEDLKNADVKNKGVVRQRMKRVEESYLKQAPQPITDPIVRDKVAKRITVLEEQIKVGLPTAEEMRKATSVTVEQHRKWERTNKPAINEWRNLLRQLNTDTSDPSLHDRSLGDIERLRPVSAQDRLRTDGFIGGAMTYGSVPQERWDAVFPPLENTALKQAERVQEEKVEKPKRVLTPEQRAAKAKILAEARMKRKFVIERQQAEVEQPVEPETVVEA